MYKQGSLLKQFGPAFFVTEEDEEQEFGTATETAGSHSIARHLLVRAGYHSTLAVHSYSC